MGSGCVRRERLTGRQESTAGGRGRSRPTDKRPARPARSPAQAARRAPRRQGVRLSTLPAGAAPAGITPRIARRGIESSQRLGRHRYVERSLAWLVGCRRLQVRDERRADLLLGFVYLACALICLNSLNRPKGGRQQLHGVERDQGLAADHRRRATLRGVPEGDRPRTADYPPGPPCQLSSSPHRAPSSFAWHRDPLATHQPKQLRPDRTRGGLSGHRPAVRLGLARRRWLSQNRPFHGSVTPPPSAERCVQDSCPKSTSRGRLEPQTA
jgi:hypothetical protein